MNRLYLILVLSTILLNGYPQVYKNPSGTASSAATSNYRRLIIPDSLKNFYKAIDDIHNYIQKRPSTFGEYTTTNMARNVAESCSDRLLWTYVIYTDPENVMPDYYDYMTAYTRGNYPEFLRLLNKSMEAHFNMPETYVSDDAMNCWKNGIVGSYQMFLSRSPLDDCEGYKRKKEQAILLAAEKMSKGIDDQKNGWESAINLAILYSFGTRPMADGSLGVINMDYQQSLRCLDRMESQSYTTPIPVGYIFLSKALKAYDLLQIGSAQKDLNQLKQALDIYIGLWQTASDNAKWNAIFLDIVPYVQNHFHSIIYCDIIGQAHGRVYPQHFDPYFLASVKIAAESPTIHPAYNENEAPDLLFLPPHVIDQREKGDASFCLGLTVLL